jgi:hypothetical protein
MGHEEVLLEALPAPGEPLQRDTHAENRALLDEDIAERVRMLAGKLTPRQHRRLLGRYKKLWHQLNRAQYNDLVRERAEVQRECESLLEQLAVAKEDAKADLKRRGLLATARGRELTAQIAALKPKAEEFESVRNQLETHEAVVEWEIEDAANRKAFQREANTYEQQILAVFRQSPRLHHKGTDKKGKEFIKVPRIAHKFIKEDKIFYQVAISQQSALLRFLGKYRSALPYGVDITNLSHETTLENLSGACDRKVTVERGKRGETFYYVVSRLDSPDGLPRRVLYSKTMDYYPLDQHTLTPWPGGVTTDRRVVFFNFEEDPHVLIAGATKGGKSNLINAIIATLARMNSAQELQLLLIDNKGGVEFSHWQKLPHLLMPMIKEPDQVVPALQQMHAIMRRRLAAIERIGAKNLADYNRKVHPTHQLPRLVCVVDEMATLMGNADVQSELQVISSQGRAVGCHLILCTQHVINDVVHSTIKVNMVLRVAAQMPSDTASRVILDTGTAALLPKIAGRMVFRSGSIETIAQTPFISDAEVALAVKYAQEHYQAADRAELESSAPLMPKEKFSRDDLLSFAISDFEGKLTVKRMHEALGNDIVTRRVLEKMVADVIASGPIIEHDGVTYRLVKIGKGYALHPVPQEVPQESDDTLDTGNSGNMAMEAA